MSFCDLLLHLGWIIPSHEFLELSPPKLSWALLGLEPFFILFFFFLSATSESPEGHIQPLEIYLGSSEAALRAGWVRRTRLLSFQCDLGWLIFSWQQQTAPRRRAWPLPVFLGVHSVTKSYHLSLRNLPQLHICASFAGLGWQPSQGVLLLPYPFWELSKASNCPWVTLN